MAVMRALALMLLASSAQAQTITDGDTLKIGGVVYRLWGIDAPENAQICADGWPAGRLSTTHLQEIVKGRTLRCEEKNRDRYGRIVAKCFADTVDVGAAMVRAGMAWAFVRYSTDYVEQERRAAADNLGVHAHRCAPAWKWRTDRQ